MRRILCMLLVMGLLLSMSTFETYSAPSSVLPFDAKFPFVVGTVRYSPELGIFAAVGLYGSVYTSSDGYNWAKRYIGEIHAMCLLNKRLDTQ